MVAVAVRADACDSGQPQIAVAALRQLVVQLCRAQQPDPDYFGVVLLCLSYSLF